MDDISTVSQNYNSHDFSAVYYLVNNLTKIHISNTPSHYPTSVSAGHRKTGVPTFAF